MSEHGQQRRQWSSPVILVGEDEGKRQSRAKVEKG